MPNQDAGQPAPTPPELSALLHAQADPELEEAWAAFLHAYNDGILRVARSMGGSHDLVMDRYTFVLERLREDDFRRLRAYARPGAGAFELWLIVVVRRLCLDHHRHQYGRRRETLDTHHPEEERAARRRLADLIAERTDITLVPAPLGEMPDLVLARSERARALALAVGRLSPRDRLLLRLRFGEELPAREIARLMEFPTVFHVYRQLDRVLGTLRGDLQARGVREAEA